MKQKVEINYKGLNFIQHAKEKLKNRIWINNPLSTFIILFVALAKYLSNPKYGKNIIVYIILGGSLGWFFILFRPWYKRLKTTNSIIKSIATTPGEAKFYFQKLFTNKEYFIIVALNKLSAVEKSTWEIKFFENFDFTVFMIEGKRYYFVHQFWDINNEISEILDLTNYS